MWGERERGGSDRHDGAVPVGMGTDGVEGTGHVHDVCAGGGSVSTVMGMMGVES